MESDIFSAGISVWTPKLFSCYFKLSWAIRMKTDMNKAGKHDSYFLET